MKPVSVEQAQAIINDVQVTNGGFSPEVQKGLPEQALRAFKNLQSIAGGSIVHVAEDLYDADTRFIFELIQNAEDNRYHIASSEGESPFLHFTLHRDSLTIDSNEDGFSEADVRAICSIHHSSKKQVGGYIGHKGIGFKSVFKIAHKVCIQSGPFCFFFEHRHGESGLGMITPYNSTPQVLPNGVRTRISLFLLDSDDFDTRANELREISDTLLLFLRKLRKLTIEIPSLDHRVSFTRHKSTEENLVTLIKQANDVEHKRFYYMEKSILSDLPQHHTRQHQHETDLILAFPVTQSFSPVIERQHVYSFLPMRDEGFNFVIQSDFITQANRQGIHKCPRNEATRENISILFSKAVEHFCKHDTLAHEWLQYLPSPHIHDKFWAELRELIFDKLKESPILFCGSGALKRPCELQRLSPRHCDSLGQPLLDDIAPEVYLSQSYISSRHAENLIDLGVTNLSYRSILDRLQLYLLGPHPRFLDTTQDYDWHTRVSDLLLRALRSPGTQYIKDRIKSMPLVPTVLGNLLSGTSGICFPDDAQGNAIPTDLMIPVIDRKALENPSRRKLYESLGVTLCKPSLVIKSILKRYNRYGEVSLSQSVAHLNYLFRTLGKDEGLNTLVFLMDQFERPIYRAFPTLGVTATVDDLYFETLSDYGTKQLAGMLRQQTNTESCPSFNMHIIHSAYTKSLPPAETSHGRTWEQWLEEVASVRRIPRLKRPRQDALSNLGSHLARYHPITCIGILKTNWECYQLELTANVVQGLREMNVPCHNGQKKHKLCDTYYPSSEMLRLCADATVEGDFELFLDIPDNLLKDGTDGWNFLVNLGVTLHPDIRFFSIILEKLLELPDDIEPGDTVIISVFKVYEELSVRFSDQRDELVRHIFNKYAAVLLPGRMEIVWLEHCVWDGHPCLRNCLSQYPQFSHDRQIKRLFRDTLLIPDADYNTYITELQMREEDSQDGQLDVSLDDVKALYGKISEEADSSDSDSVLAYFEDYYLVYVPGERSWVPPERCLWTEAPNIGAQFGISTAYPGLENFFRDVLKVQSPTVATYVRQLRSIVSNDPVDMPEIKAIIHKINLLGPDNLTELSGTNFLPVAMPNGEVKILKATDTFFIADRIEYHSAFKRMVPILAFSLEETRRLDRLLSVLDLNDRFMSTAVQEKTVVQSPSEESSSTETRAFRKKARHIYRIIMHYNAASPMTDSHHGLEVLQNSVVYAGGGFKKTLELNLNEFSVKVESDRGLVHVENRDDGLSIYIPSNLRDRQLCYSRQLPQALARLFELGGDASMMLQLVFANAEDFIICDSLDGNGIVGLPQSIPELNNEPTQENSPAGSVVHDNAVEDHDIVESEDQENDDHHINTPVSSPDIMEEFLRPVTTGLRTSSPSPRPFTIPHSSSTAPGPPPELFTPESPYVRLLDKVIRIARRSTLQEVLLHEETTVFDNENIDHELAFGVRSRDQIEHDIRIGAAGELFVFELLLSHGLPGFSRVSWRSTIRKQVVVHPEYNDLPPWNGVETADIVYHDDSSALTTLLVDAGYLRQSWPRVHPTYYIEVKTTTGECDNAFFMSKSQYRRMERMRIDPSSPPDEIYVVFRVYQLGKNGMGVKIYVDPETLRRDQRLVFTSESYSVRPGLPN